MPADRNARAFRRAPLFPVLLAILSVPGFGQKEEMPVASGRIAKIPYKLLGKTAVEATEALTREGFTSIIYLSNDECYAGLARVPSGALVRMSVPGPDTEHSTGSDVVLWLPDPGFTLVQIVSPSRTAGLSAQAAAGVGYTLTDDSDVAIAFDDTRRIESYVDDDESPGDWVTLGEGVAVILVGGMPFPKPPGVLLALGGLLVGLVIGIIVGKTLRTRS